MSEQFAITSKKVLVKKGKNTILNQMSFNVKAGSITGLVGPSGSGKTTLMRAVVGVQKFNGELHVLGRDAGSKKLRDKIGYVTQSPAVYRDLTVLQNLRYFATLVRAQKDSINSIIESVHLEKQKNQVVGTLSGGQEARVSLAVALLGNPELLVLDEPTVGLDPILRNELWDLFTDLSKQGKTILVSSHVMDEAQRCENVLLLREGKLLWHDSLNELLRVTKKSDVGDAFVTMIHAADKAEQMKEEASR